MVGHIEGSTAWELFITAVWGATCGRHTGVGIFPTSTDGSSGLAGKEGDRFKSGQEGRCRPEAASSLSAQ